MKVSRVSNHHGSIPLTVTKKHIMSTLKELMEEIKSPEYKQEQIDKNQKYLDEVTMDYQLGEYVGEYIVSHYLPTLSTDMLHTNKVINVSEEDTLENKRLDEEWFSTTRHNDNWDGVNDGNNEMWKLYLQHNKMLEKKYLPPVLECYFGLIKFNDELEFKKGIQESLWQCDMCSYNIDIENIKIKYEMEWGATIISFQLD